jgi:hypothetical protein
VRKTLLDSADVLQPIFARYGLEFRAPKDLDVPPVAEAGARSGAPNLRVVSSS